MISVEHLMEIQERLHEGENIDDVFNDVYELGRADAIKEFKDLGKLYSEIRADAIEEILTHTKTIVDEDGIIHEVVLVKDIEKLREKRDEYIQD